MHFRQYIDFKRNLGYKFIDAESKYCLFDRFVLFNGESKIGITKELADEWAIKRPNESGLITKETEDI